MSASPVAASAATRLRSPGAWMPSSLLTSTRGRRAGGIVYSALERVDERKENEDGNARSFEASPCAPLVFSSVFRFLSRESEKTTTFDAFSSLALSFASPSLLLSRAVCSAPLGAPETASPLPQRSSVRTPLSE